MNTPLLRTKLFIPLLQPNQISRLELIQRLNSGLENGCPLFLVSAPAGSGKTSLLADWLAGLQTSHSAACAWLALEESENDPIRFWSYCIAALQTIHPEVGKNSLELLQAAQPAAAEVYLTLLINDLAECQDQLVLVLDDFQLIQNLAVQQGLVFWINHLPAQIHLVLSSRTDPLLPLARLRARRQMLELRYQDLRFSTSEAGLFLRATLQLPLSDDEISILVDRTEGWAAGLQIAALSLKKQQDSAAYIRTFSSLDRNLVDYFSEEILANLPADLQSFLLMTASLDRFTAELCQVISQNPDSSSLFDQLERENLFIVPLDNNRQWYRFHSLFSDLLRHRLAKSISKDEQLELHRRASCWFELNGMDEDALLQALTGQDFDRAGALLQRLGIWHILSGQSITVLSWWQRFPGDWLADHPDL
ncbi:MAG TPA: AAA family ATPase, partial [Anaerolineaceae bacterium]|nr:AAA family ATPase [Anaerolineaceae bacterium]